ncbi:wax ester/triacylglycerol synthase family O-acyltransferase [Marinobacter sp. chi1]|uniref:diacylglycerol O-acyltransferase n=1 Tax=Marinobacter suaedae TaxID=3057675 RepID=A0ABT8VVY7_9GAMM|nr:wax ester/triacylglycerol synthase family O-acyltransferase [Marinobacter sp. chi1]MDO3720134.1 wax ester/triacylglycerol synthase family O-acyltransferase [Marinobacter sp. chi1]
MNSSKLSPMDSAFIQLETPRTPMHVAALMVFEAPEEGVASFVKKLMEDGRKETRITSPWNKVLVSGSRWQLAPSLVTSYDPDLEYHLRHLSLPAPGGEKELGQLVAQLHSQPMDLRKLLWECVVIDGLEGDRFAIYVKFHHSIVDGVSGASLLMNGLSDHKDDLTTPPFWVHAAPEKPLSLKRLKLPSLGETMGTAKNVLKMFGENDSLTTLRSAPRSPLNGRIGPQRRFATQAFPLERLKAVARHEGVTLNDVVACLVGGSLRRYLKDITALPKESLTAAIPMSLREAGDMSSGNAVGMIYSIVGTNIADPVVRLHEIHASTSEAKKHIQELSPEMRVPYSLASMAPAILKMLSGMGGTGRPMFNIVVSNVPGGRQEKYLRGARLLHLYPANIVFQGMAVSFTCYSHAGTLNVGIIACRDSVPHMQRLATGLTDALVELEEGLGITGGEECP